MKTFIALLCIFLPLIAAPAFAANAWNERDLTWFGPATCADGSPLTSCAITGYKLEAAGSCTAPTWNALATVGPTVFSYHATLNPGSYCFRAKATSANGDSAPGPTNLGSQTLVVQPPPPPPAPPGAVTVAAAIAYEIRPNSTGTLVASRIGLIPLGTQCQTDTRTVAKVTYNRVDPKSVDLLNWPMVLPPVDVFARCS